VIVGVSECDGEVTSSVCVSVCVGKEVSAEELSMGAACLMGVHWHSHYCAHSQSLLIDPPSSENFTLLFASAIALHQSKQVLMSCQVGQKPALGPFSPDVLHMRFDMAAGG
jgi:hypothetical protein